ncbi:ANTAR domain-containing protein [Cellulomonas sp. 179-A 4D5 NHS]|uniref:ANTAR domain-containing protein n=1 Tax=Cellulomonas sp. 179-A 4D5 NHS TaxID=3142378 RepID=UPI00399EEC17
MRFISPSVLLLDYLEATTPALGAVLQTRARLIAKLVPSCMAVSAVLTPTGLTLALLADDHADPSAPGPEWTTSSTGGALDELAWHQQRARDPDARCAASLALPLRTTVGATGYLAIYSTDPRAFQDLVTVLTTAGAPGETAVTNHDLPMRTLDDAYRGPAALGELDDIELAVGFLVTTLRVSPDDARHILRLGALRRGVTLAAHARTILNPFDL